MTSVVLKSEFPTFGTKFSTPNDDFRIFRSLDSTRLLLHLHGIHEDQPVHQQGTSPRLGEWRGMCDVRSNMNNRCRRCALGSQSLFFGSSSRWGCRWPQGVLLRLCPTMKPLNSLHSTFAVQKTASGFHSLQTARSSTAKRYLELIDG